jgi:aspartate/methionine/tyrosine aminotransferase
LIGHPLETCEGRWELDVEAFLEACKPAKAVLINSLSNPTGFMPERDEMDHILKVLRARGTWLISDEVYAGIVFDRPVAPSFLDVAEPEDRLIVVNSFSKSWAMTGWRLGWLTWPPLLTPLIEKIAEFSVACAPPFAQQAAVTALQEGEPFIAETTKQYSQALAVVQQRLGSHPRVTFPPPQSAFYAFFHVSGIEETLPAAQSLITEAQVGLAPGEAFLTKEPGWFRLCFAQSQVQFEQALERILMWLDRTCVSPKRGSLGNP